MANDEYDKVELPALNQLQSLGWIYVEGSALSPEESEERKSFKDVVLEKRLSRSIKQINSWINNENLRKVVRDLTRAQFPNLIEANQSNWQELTQYISVFQDLGQGNRGQTVKIIDFDNHENNEFLCTISSKSLGSSRTSFPTLFSL